MMIGIHERENMTTLYGEYEKNFDFVMSGIGIYLVTNDTIKQKNL